jgi:hypothetical protein
MGANSSKVLHVDTTNFPVYDNDDLNYFQSILNDIVDDNASLNSLSTKEREYLRVQLAAAIFRGAGAGERDYVRLKRSAIEAVSAVPSSDPGS